LLVTGTYTNITETVADQENLRLFGEAFKHTLDWVIIYNHKFYPIAFNDAFKKFFNIKDDINAPKELDKLLKLQTSETARFWQKLLTFKVGHQWQGEDRILLVNGDSRDIMVHIHAVASVHDKTRIEHFLVIFSDITEQKAAEAKLLTLANFDSLTGLPNRTLLLDRIERGLEHAKRTAKSMAVFFIDLDKFKQVNDSLGHKAGDELLIIIAKRLSDKLRKEDTVARLGGDEFVIMIEDVSSVEAISALVTEISFIIDTPVTLSSQTVSVSSSIGIAMYPGDGLSAEDLLKNADIAMYHAKKQGRSNFQFFTQQMDELVKSRLKLENQLKKAHQAKKFENYYQPIFNTQSQKIEGFEILMRWPTRNGMITPKIFIPVSEELGLIEHMTLDAFERAMPVLNEMRQNGFTGYLSVNLSAKHFENQSSIDKIILLLEQNKIPVTAIRFEITESALMRDYDKALTYMTQIKQKGFLIALDDFGTGFSSQKYHK
jgi:diguanylate cyclase (GGDEF)-like protein